MPLYPYFSTVLEGKTDVILRVSVHRLCILSVTQYTLIASFLYSVILKATSGDEDALSQILKHYEPLIVDASKRMIRTGADTMVEIADEDIRAFIESELVLAIVNNYDPYRRPEKKTTKRSNKTG